MQRLNFSVVKCLRGCAQHSKTFFRGRLGPWLDVLT